MAWVRLWYRDFRGIGMEPPPSPVLMRVFEIVYDSVHSDEKKVHSLTQKEQLY